MNKTETAQLLTIIALVDRRTISELDVETWHRILGSLDYARCEAAVIDHRRHSPGVWLEPGHVWMRAKTTTDGEADRAHGGRPRSLAAERADVQALEQATGMRLAELTRPTPRAIAAADIRDQPTPEVDAETATAMEAERRRQLDALETLPPEQAAS